MEHDRGQCEKKNVYVYVCVYVCMCVCVCVCVCIKLGHFDVQQKLTEHCKSSTIKK